jgi:CheY-like chemotaxis protein
VRIDKPGVHQGGQRQKDETEHGNQQPGVSPAKIVGEEKHQDQDRAGKSQNENEEQTRHLAALSQNRRPVARRGQPPVESDVRMSTMKRTVLIVDDDPQILRLVEKMLRPHGVEILLAPRASEALRICEQHPVHLMISDIMMPEMDGNKLAERVLKLKPEAQVLLISGHDRGQHTPKSPRVHFLRKPFFPSVLIQILKELLPEV